MFSYYMLSDFLLLSLLLLLLLFVVVCPSIISVKFIILVKAQIKELARYSQRGSYSSFTCTPGLYSIPSIPSTNVVM